MIFFQTVTRQTPSRWQVFLIDHKTESSRALRLLGSILKRFGGALGSILKRFGDALGSILSAILKRFGVAR